MQELCDYSNVVAEVASYFDEFALRAQGAGVKEWILDPGFGFAKTIEQNYALLRGLSSFKKGYGERGYRPEILVGISRKSMIYRPLEITPDQALPATQALHMAALERGADILRVHDVAQACETVKLYSLIS